MRERPPMGVNRQVMIDYEKQFVRIITELGGDTNKIIADVYKSVSVNDRLDIILHQRVVDNIASTLDKSQPVSFNISAVRNPEDLRVISEDTVETAALDTLPEDGDDLSVEDYLAIAEPFLVEVLIAFIPGGDVIDLIRSIDAGDKAGVAFALGGLVASTVGGSALKGTLKSVRVIRKIGVLTHKLGRAGKAAAKATRKGFETAIGETGNLIVKKGGRVIAQGDDAVRTILTKIDNLPTTGIRVVDDFVAQLKHVDELAQADLPNGYRLIQQADGSKYIRRVDASNASTPRLGIDLDGNPVPYTAPARLASNGTLRNRLGQSLGRAIPDGHQAHHLVPDNVVRNSPLHQKAIQEGVFDLDRVSNGKLLAESADDFVDGVSNNLPTHLGSHPNYDTAINNAIDDVLDSNNIDIFDIDSLSRNQLESLVDAVENRAVNILENWGPSRLN